MIRVQFDDSAIIPYLTRLSGQMSDLTPVLQDIGELLTETTKRRFDTSTSPDGARWPANSQVTILQYLGMHKGNYKKDGSLSKSGASRSASKKPLIGETKSLSTTINYKLDGKTAVEIGSPEEYAAMQHFGGKKSDFPNLWGNIPARPFLGLSDDDRDSILDIIEGYLRP